MLLKSERLSRKKYYLHRKLNGSKRMLKNPKILKNRNTMK